jgi:hypothetical protein
MVAPETRFEFDTNLFLGRTQLVSSSRTIKKLKGKTYSLMNNIGLMSWLE